MRTILILNPASGSSIMAAHNATPQQNEVRIVSYLRTYGVEPEVWYTTREDPGNELARRAAAQGADLIIAAGGDGTVDAVASGLIGTRSTLAIIPLGTMNNLARSLGIPESIEGACLILATGETHQIDAGEMNDRTFLEVAGIGLGAALFPSAEEIKSSSWLSIVHGVLSGILTLFAFRPIMFHLSFDGHKAHSYKALQVTVCNTPSYGVHLQLVPGIMIDDGLLDVVIYKNFSKWEYLRHALSINQGKRSLQPRVTHRKVRSLQLRTRRSVQLQVDGLPHGHTPATITVTPRALRVRVPKSVASGATTQGD